MATRQIGIAPFGVTAQGQAVSRITIGQGGLCASILTWGAVLQGLWLQGLDHSLTIGSDRLADYEGEMRFHGALVGPVANRLTGAMAPIAGHPQRLDVGLPHALHSGTAGTHQKPWKLAEMSETACTLRLDLPDNEGGFPGNRRVTARFSVEDGATLRLGVTVSTDRTTLINFANHSYWNLDGTPDFSGHALQILADRYLPATPEVLPTGEIAPVSGSAMDFRTPRRLTPGSPPLDTNFCLSDRRRPLTEAAVLTGRSGTRMTLATTEPGLQVYDCRNPRPGHGPHEALAIEAQSWPDAPNHPGFPPIELEPGQTYEQMTEWRFTRA